MNRISKYSVEEPIVELAIHVLHDVDLRQTVGLSRCPVARTAADVAAVFEDMAHLDGDALVACAVDEKLRIVRWSLLAVSRNNFASVRPIDALIGAIRSKAKGVILIENRRKWLGAPESSALVLSIEHASRLLGYTLLDHVIIGKDGEIWSRSCRTISRSQTQPQQLELALKQNVRL